jgi:hypothetical protein
MIGVMQRTGDQIKIPKIPITVDVTLEGQATRAVEIWVAEHQDHSYRRQHVIDLLESESRFLPAHDVAADETSLFNKGSLVTVGIPLAGGELPVEESPETIDDELFDIRALVRVEIRGTDPLRGHILYSPPAAQARVADYLNQSGWFFRLWTETHVYLVNKAYVVRVTELPEGE